MIDEYFRKELEYIKEFGNYIAKEKPHLANFISEQSNDPDVERLLEGFAFLTGTLRRKIEDELPEFTHGLIKILWPNYLRIVPSMTIIEVTQNEKVKNFDGIIPKGTKVLSKYLTQDGRLEDEYPSDSAAVRCIFKTCKDINVFPFFINKIVNKNSSNRAIMSIDFIAQDDEINMSSSILNKMRIFLNSNEYTNQQLFLWFSYYLEYAEIIFNGQIIKQDIILQPSGFAQDERVLPYSKKSFTSHQLFHEYFSFPDSFLFFDFVGFTIKEAISVKNFSINLFFSQPLPPDIKVKTGIFKLNCSPAVNLFDYDSEPIYVKEEKEDYFIACNYKYPEWYDIFSVDEVKSYKNTKLKTNINNREQSEELTYVEFESFEHDIGNESSARSKYYKLKIKDSMYYEGLKHYISLINTSESGLDSFVEECISIKLTCTNRDLASNLRIGDISIPSNNAPTAVKYKNITKPTIPLYPILDSRAYWKLISNASLNYLSLSNLDVFKEVLLTYNLANFYSNKRSQDFKRKLSGILKIESNLKDKLYKGVMIRGTETVLHISQSKFNCEGDMFIFCTVISEFLSLHSSINSFNKLLVINLDNQEKYEWPVKIGNKKIL